MSLGMMHDRMPQQGPGDPSGATLCGRRDAMETLLAIAGRYRHLEQCMLDPGAQAHFRELALDYEQRAEQIAEAIRSWPAQS